MIILALSELSFEGYEIKLSILLSGGPLPYNNLDIITFFWGCFSVRIPASREFNPKRCGESLDHCMGKQNPEITGLNFDWASSIHQVTRIHNPVIDIVRTCSPYWELLWWWWCICCRIFKYLQLQITKKKHKTEIHKGIYTLENEEITGFSKY